MEACEGVALQSKATRSAEQRVAKYRLLDGSLSPVAYPIVARVEDGAGHVHITLRISTNADGTETLRSFPEAKVVPLSDAGTLTSWAAFLQPSDADDTASASSHNSFTSLGSYGEVLPQASKLRKKHQAFVAKHGMDYVEQAVDILAERLGPGDAALEVGSRGCTGIPVLCATVGMAGTVSGIAMDPTERKEAMEHLRSLGLHERVTIHDRTPAWRLTAPASLDGILLSYVLEMFDGDDAQTVLCECHACLKPTGYLAVVCATASGLFSSKASGLRQSLETAGFSTDVVKSSSLWGWQVEIILASLMQGEPGGLNKARLEQASLSPVCSPTQQSSQAQPSSARLTSPSPAVPRLPLATLNTGPQPAALTSPPKDLPKVATRLFVGKENKARAEEGLPPPTSPAPAERSSPDILVLQRALQERGAQVNSLQSELQANNKHIQELEATVEAIQADPCCTYSQLLGWCDGLALPLCDVMAAAELSCVADGSLPALVRLGPLVQSLLQQSQDQLRLQRELSNRLDEVAALSDSLKTLLAQRNDELEASRRQCAVLQAELQRKAGSTEPTPRAKGVGRRIEIYTVEIFGIDVQLSLQVAKKEGPAP